MDQFLKKVLVFAVSWWVYWVHFFAPKKGVVLAYRYFSEPRKGKLNKQDLPAVLQRAEVKMVSWSTHFFPVYFWNFQHSESVLLVHGWESNAARWESFISCLAKKFNVYAIDAPAHGLASGKEFNAILYAQFIQKAQELFPTEYLVGHSMGGMACYFYAYQNPQTQMKKMVLLAAPATLKQLIVNFAQLLQLNPKLLRQLEDFFVAQFNYRFDEFSIENFGSKIVLEGMIVHDTEDDVVRFEEAQKINQAWKKAFLQPTKGLGHHLQDVDLYQSIMAFLDKK